MTYKVDDSLTIWLLSGEHKLTSVSNSISVPNLLNPLSGSELPQSIRILTLMCSSSSHPECAIDKATVKLYEKDFNLIVPNELQLKDLILSGAINLKPGCTADTCYYCPYPSGIAINDQGESVDIDTYAEQGLCIYFREKSFLTLNASGTLKLTSMIVRDFRQQYMSVIESLGGKMVFTDTDFINMIPSNRTLENAVISQRQCQSNFFCGSLEYNGGSISQLNNGYEYQYFYDNDRAQFNGFFYATSISLIKLTNIKANYNYIYSPVLITPVGTLFKLTDSLQLLIEDCEFSYNIAATSPVFSVVQTKSWPVVNEGGISKWHNLTHIMLKNTLFTQNTALSQGILYIQASTEVPNVLIEGCNFSHNIGFGSPGNFYVIMGNSAARAVDTTFGGVKIPASWFKVKSSKFEDNVSSFGLFSITNVPNLAFTNVEITKNGYPASGVVDVSSYTMTAFINNPELLFSRSINLSLSQCSNLGLIRGSVNVQISGGSFTSNSCSTESSPTLTFSLVTNLSVTDFLISSNYQGSGSLGRALVFGAFNAQIRRLTVKDNINLDASRGVVEFGRRDQVTPSSFVLEDCLVDSNYAETTGVIYFNSLTSVVVRNSSFTKNTSNSNGGVAYFLPQSKVELSIALVGCKFTDNSTKFKGSLYVEKAESLITFSVDSCEFSKNKASEGSVLYLESSIASTSMFVNSLVQGNISERSAAIYLKTSDGNFAIKNCRFLQNTSALTAGVVVAMSSGSLEVSENTFIANSADEVLTISKIAYKQLITFKKNTFSLNLGVSLSANYCNFTDVDSTYSNNLSKAITLSDSSIATMLRIQFKSNSGSEIGGAILLTTVSSLVCDNCDFLENSATDKAGAVYIERGSSFTALNSKFMRNKSNLGSVLFLTASKDAVSLLRNCVVTENNSTSYGSIYLSESSLTFEFSAMYQNLEIGGISPGFNLFKSTLNIKGSELRDQKSYKGTFVLSTFRSIVNIENSSILRGSASSVGGAIFTDSTSVSIRNCTCSSSQAINGACMYLDNSVTAIYSSSFSQNLASASGGDAYAKLGSLEVYDSLFTNSRKAAFQLELLSLAKFSGVTMKGGITVTRVAAINVKLLVLEKSFFISNNATQGSALYASGSSSVVVTNNTFFNNTACEGGALYLDSGNSIFDNNIFEANQAFCNPYTGGAVEIDCSVGCLNNFTNNSFISNSARLQGGAIHWSALTPNMKNNLFLNNSAVYGNNFASFIQKIDLVKNISKMVNLTEIIVSGQKVTQGLVFKLFDPQGQVVESDNTTTCELFAEGAELTGEYKTTSNKGVLTFVDFSLSAAPGTYLTLVAYCLDSSIQTFSEEFFVRKCILGEAQDGIKCTVCPPESYSLDPSQSCSDCPSNAKCYGNYTMVPKEGYWRRNYLSDQFFECPRSNSCLGPVESDYSLTGKCEKGYEGVKCSGCSKGYSMTGRFECSECIQTTKTYVMRVFLGLMLIAFSVGSVWLSLRTATRNRSLISVYFKILMNYFQVTSVTIYFKLNWPDIFVKLINANLSIGEASDKAFSASCFFPDLNSKENYYINLTVIAVLPFSLIGASIIVWTFFRAFKQIEKWREKLLGTMTVLIFLIHPYVTKMMFSIFSCEKVEIDYWLTSDFSIQCWDSEHYFYVFAFALPSLIVWTLFLPLFCIVYLCKRRNKLDSISTKYVLGFLYHGFRSEVFYWEIVVLYRKNLVIIVAVFMNSTLTNQAVTAVLLLYFFYILQIRVQPYTCSKLNLTEELSITVSMVTISCGLYFLTNETGEVGIFFLFAIVLLANSAFFLYWLKEVSILFVQVLIKRYPRLIEIRICRSIFKCYKEDAVGSNKSVSVVRPHSPQEHEILHRAPPCSFDIPTFMNKSPGVSKEL